MALKLGIGMGALLLAAAACAPAASPTPAPHALAGTFDLYSDDVDVHFDLTPQGVNIATKCVGTGGFVDISPGLGVTVRDGAGAVIATSAIQLDPSHSSRSRCAYTFMAVIPDADFYSIEVGHRGELTYSREDLEARNWQVGLSLGQ